MSPTTQLRVGYSDDDIRQRVSRFLHNRHFSAFRHIVVEVEHGSVTLSGCVRSFYEKQVVMTTCQRVAGVLSLIDQISVQTNTEARLLNRPR